MHLHEAACPLSVHSAFIPHGEGLQGCMTSIGLGVAIIHSFSFKMSSICITLTWWPITLSKWITYVPRDTNANWIMVPNIAFCIDTTKSWTRILTFPVDACFVYWAVSIYCTFWSTVWWWTNHFRQTRALTSIPYISRWVGIGSTWIGITWIICFYGFNC